MSCRRAYGRRTGRHVGRWRLRAPKRIPSLLGTASTEPYAWNGSLDDLMTQVKKSVSSTMHGPPLSDAALADLTAYVASLPSPPPRLVSPDERLVTAGRELFESRGCVRCHAPPIYTSPATYDVTLRDEQGRSEFNPFAPRREPPPPLAARCPRQATRRGLAGVEAPA
ncbi:MAG: di-heme oxidoredictase family protein [Planctomycetaceae bacterium]